MRRVAEWSSWAWWSGHVASLWPRVELRWLVAILVLAAALRIVWVIYAAREPLGLHDPTSYFVAASEIAEGNGYTAIAPDGSPSPTAYYPVGYPAALGGVFALVKYMPIPNNFVLAGAFFNVFLSVATIGLAYGVARWLFTPTVGLVTALWLAFFPNLIFHTATFLTETLFVFLMMAALLVLVWGGRGEMRLSWPRLIGFGALLGLSILVRPISALFLPAMLVVWLAFGFGWRRSLAHVGLALAIVVAFILPWSIRNLVVMDSPVILSTNLGDNLCIGNSPNAPGSFWVPNAPGECFDPAAYEGLKGPELEVKRNNRNARKGLRFIVENPRTELQLLSRKSFHMWEHDHDGLSALESYGDDPFIGAEFSYEFFTAAIPEDLLTVVTANVADLTGNDPEELLTKAKERRRGGDAAPIVIDIDAETRRSLLGQGLDVRVDSELRWVLSLFADNFFFVTISLGAVGLIGLVLRPWDARRVFFFLALLSLAGIPLVFFGDPRFHVPVTPLLVVTAAWLVVTGATALSRLLAPRSAPVS